jgi:hypothetical protein
MKLTIITAAPAGTYIAFALALYVWHVAAALLGAFIADRLGVSDSSFDLKSDLKKTGVCSLIALALFFLLFYFAQHPAVFIVYILVFLLSLKAAYLGSDQGSLFIILGTAMAGMIVFVPVVECLGLKVIFSLYLVAFIVLLVRQLVSQQVARGYKEAERIKKKNIRRLAGQDPSFATFCHSCAYFHQDSGRCLLQVDGKAVSEIKIAHRTYCTSFVQRQAGQPQASGPGPH